MKRFEPKNCDKIRKLNSYEGFEISEKWVWFWQEKDKAVSWTFYIIWNCQQNMTKINGSVLKSKALKSEYDFTYVNLSNTVRLSFSSFEY